MIVPCAPLHQESLRLRIRAKSLVHLGEDLFGLRYVLRVFNTRLFHLKLLDIDDGLSFAPPTSDHGVELIKSRWRHHLVGSLLWVMSFTSAFKAKNCTVYESSGLSATNEGYLLQRVLTGRVGWLATRVQVHLIVWLGRHYQIVVVLGQDLGLRLFSSGLIVLAYIFVHLTYIF